MANINEIGTVSEGKEASELNRREFGKLALVGLAATIVASKAEHVLADEINPTLASVESGPLLPQQIMKKHGEAIELGRTEYIRNTMKEDKFISGRFANKSDDWKVSKADSYYEDVLMNFIQGKDNGSLNKLVIRAPLFTEYIMVYSDDFSLAGALQTSYDIAKLDQSISKIRKSIIELKEVQAREKVKKDALRRLRTTISGT